jgi:hypothetical protein
MRIIAHLGTLGAILLALFAVAASPVQVAAQQGATFTIAVYTCPPGFTGTDQAFLDCSDRPTAGVAVHVIDLDDDTNSVTQTTVADGTTTFDLSAFTAGQIAVFVERDVFFNPPAAFCSVDGGGANEQPVDVLQRDPGPDAARFVIEPQAGSSIGCDFYIVPSPDEPTPAPNTPAPTQQPDGDATVTIYKTACPPGYTGDDYFEDCFDNPQAAVEFFLARGGGGVEGTTGLDGFVSLMLPADALPGVATAQETVPAGYAVDFFVYCTKDDGATVVDTELSEGAPGPEGETTFFASFDVEGGDQIRCDWYNLLPAEGPAEPTVMPEPGRPAVISTGDCPGDGDVDEPGDLRVDLNDLTSPEGEPVGQEDAIAAELSFTTTQFSLEELLAEDHLIGIGPDSGNEGVEVEATADNLVACGEIGGVLDEDATLAIRLSAVDDSGFSGIAVLTPNQDDPTQTDISLFVAEEPDRDTNDVSEAEG